MISVPHGGTLGSDTSPGGNILCDTGHVIETRKCTPQFPSLTYTRDAGTSGWRINALIFSATFFVGCTANQSHGESTYYVQIRWQKRRALVPHRMYDLNAK